MIKNFFLFLAVAMTSFASAKMIECHHFKEIYDHIDHETLIVLDIDDTLLIPEQMVGCDEWFMHRLALHQKTEDTNLALEKALAEWEGVRHLTKMTLVEKETDLIVRELQNQGYTVMGLTTQGLALATRTALQLKENQIELSKTAPSFLDQYFTISNHGVLFRNGILFTSGQSKAESLKKLCKTIDYLPKKIVFVNDKASHLKDVENFAIENGIEFTGLRYGFSDFRKKAFSKEIADYQFSHSSFDHILTDSDAQQALAH